MNKNLEFFENYLELAAGIVERTIKDYIQYGWWLNNNPEPTETQGAYFCKYNNAVRELADAKAFLDDKTGLLQEIYSCNQAAIDYIVEACEYVASKGEYDTDKNGDIIFLPVVNKKTGEVKRDASGNIVKAPVKIDKKVLYKYILPIVNDSRVAIGLDKVEKLD